jgi:hypothetical protein
MAALARGHGLDVELARFEAWDPGVRRFDLLISGQAPALGGAPLTRPSCGPIVGLVRRFGTSGHQVRRLCEPGPLSELFMGQLQRSPLVTDQACACPNEQ